MDFQAVDVNGAEAICGHRLIRDLFPCTLLRELVCSLACWEPVELEVCA